MKDISRADLLMPSDMSEPRLAFTQIPKEKSLSMATDRQSPNGPKLMNIKVEGLFGIFDYDIPLFIQDRVTILFGQNGLGKTTLLRLLNDFFSGNYSEVALYSFSSLRLTFSDSTTVEVTRPTPSDGDQVGPGTLVVQASGHEQWAFEALTEEHVFRVLRSLPPVEPYRQLRNQLLHGRLTLSALRELEQRQPRVWARIMEAAHSEEPEWLTEIRERFPATFIPSDRLNPASVPTEEEDPRRQRPEPVLSYYSKLVARNIGSTVDKYAEKSQALDRSFLRRLADRFQKAEQGAQGVSHMDISDALSNLEKSRHRLSELGLLDSEAGFDLLRPEELKAVPPAVVELHVNDNIEKLAQFDDLAKRVELLYQISRQRLKFKRLAIDKTEGLTVSARDPKQGGGYKRRLRLSDLSSGEQHHLVLLTKLLFDVPVNSLILIDEPEISMHIVWQHELLSDLKKVADHIDADLFNSYSLPADYW